MEKPEFDSIAIKDMDKCAMIYRRDAASFIYVCYHCGTSFANIDCTLQHIESHFQLVQVTIDEKDVKSELDLENASDTDNIRDTTDPKIEIMISMLVRKVSVWHYKIKAEVMEIEEDFGGDTLEKPRMFDCQRCDSVFSSKFSLRSHTLRDHFKKALKCGKCEKTFKRVVSFKNHLRQHIDRGEVDWNCEGDGIQISEPSLIAAECPEQQGKSGSPAQVEKVEKQSEKRQPKKENKTKQVTSKQKTPQLSTYNCHKCSETYSTSNDLKVHLNAHSKCKECKTYFKSAFDLRLHVLEIHLSVKNFKCSSCLTEFKKEEKSLFEKHLELHLSNNSANWTNICDGICNSGKDATKFEEITKITELCCELCEEKFYLKSKLDEHIRCMHSENEHKYRCPKCKSVFTNLKCYFAHQLEHRRVGSTVTETDMNVLITNLNSYVEEQFVCNTVENASSPYQCLICYTERSDPIGIRRHIRELHVYKMLPQPIKPNRKETTVTCNICGMVIQRNCFRTHFKTHTDKKKYPCSFCDRTFSKKYSKTTHERMHTGEKPFQCDQCGKRFFSNSLLGAHKQAHDNTIYPCKICGRVFNIPSGYRRHIQIHRKNSFECTICFKSFNTRVYLTRHMSKHGEKKFQCSFCENKFNTVNGKQRHEKTKHNYEPPFLI